MSENNRPDLNDMCDLDPSKVCDNCCKCLEKPGEEYSTLVIDFERFEDENAAWADAVGGELYDPELLLGAVASPDIDPALMAEWEAKLKAAEEAERTNVMPRLHGVRRRKEYRD